MNRNTNSVYILRIVKGIGYNGVQQFIFIISLLIYLINLILNCYWIYMELINILKVVYFKLLYHE